LEILAFLRALWRRRLLVAVGAAVAIALAVILSGGDSSRLGTASARVVLDTPDSQLVHAEPPGADSLGWRAAVLADLAATRPLKTQIARELRIPLDRLAVVAPQRAEPSVATPLARSAAEAAAITPEPYVVAIRSRDPLPIISIDASAPSRSGAAKLAAAAETALVAASRTPADAYDVQEFLVERVGPIRTDEVVNAPRRVVGLVAAAVVFGLWCLAVMVATSAAGRRRSPGRMRLAGISSR
jgi:hypothetical protein